MRWRFLFCRRSQSVMRVEYENYPSVFDLQEDATYFIHVFNKNGHVLGYREGGNTDKLLEEHWAKMRYNSRTWLILSHIKKDYQELILEYFDAHGKRLDEFHDAGSSIFLYDLSRR